MDPILNGHTVEMIPESPEEMHAIGYPTLQVIDEDKVFSPEVTGYLDNIQIEKCWTGIPPNIVFGSQSTGKSTLLNALFGTRFDVMDESRRKQTTKGIWM